MPTPSLPIRTIVEQSVAARINQYAADLPGVQIHLGQTDEIRSLPIIIVHAESRRRPKDLGAFWSGNFEITVNIHIYSSADDSTLDEHRARVDGIDAILADVPALQAAWVQGILKASWFETDDEAGEGRRYGNILSYTMVGQYPTAS